MNDFAVIVNLRAELLQARQSTPGIARAQEIFDLRSAGRNRTENRRTMGNGLITGNDNFSFQLRRGLDCQIHRLIIAREVAVATARDGGIIEPVAHFIAVLFL